MPSRQVEFCQSSRLRSGVETTYLGKPFMKSSLGV
jgi:hypothetical protein